MEIQGFERLAIHHDVAAAVDSVLRGRALDPELRFKSAEGEVVVEAGRTAPSGALEPLPLARSEDGAYAAYAPPAAKRPRAGPLKLHAYGVSQNRLRQVSKALNVPAIITDDVNEAGALLTLKSYYRKRPIVIQDAEMRGIPIYVLRSNTTTQIEHALADLFGVSAPADEMDLAVRQTEEAIREILLGARDMVELYPQSAGVRRRQHEMAREANLMSLSRGKEPRRRVRIFKSAHA
jgi:hypothetical protein